MWANRVASNAQEEGQKQCKFDLTSSPSAYTDKPVDGAKDQAQEKGRPLMITRVCREKADSNSRHRSA